MTLTLEGLNNLITSLTQCIGPFMRYYCMSCNSYFYAFNSTEYCILCDRIIRSTMKRPEIKFELKRSYDNNWEYQVTIEFPDGELDEELITSFTNTVIAKVLTTYTYDRIDK